MTHKIMKNFSRFQYRTTWTWGRVETNA